MDSSSHPLQNALRQNEEAEARVREALAETLAALGLTVTEAEPSGDGCWRLEVRLSDGARGESVEEPVETAAPETPKLDADSVEEAAAPIESPEPDPADETTPDPSETDGGLPGLEPATEDDGTPDEDSEDAADLRLVEEEDAAFEDGGAEDGLPALGVPDIDEDFEPVGDAGTDEVDTDGGEGDDEDLAAALAADDEDDAFSGLDLPPLPDLAVDVDDAPDGEAAEPAETTGPDIPALNVEDSNDVTVDDDPAGPPADAGEDAAPDVDPGAESADLASLLENRQEALRVTHSGAQRANPFKSSSDDPRSRAERLAHTLVSDMIAYAPDEHRDALSQGVDAVREAFADEIDLARAEYYEQVPEGLEDRDGIFAAAVNDQLGNGQNVL